MTAKVVQFDQASEAAKRYHELYLNGAITLMRSASSFIVMAFDEDGNMTPMYRCNSQEMALAGAVLLRRAAEPNGDDNGQAA